jgi:predicted nucleotide-binding protein
MRDYVIEPSPELNLKINAIINRIQPLWAREKFERCEQLFKRYYELMVLYERELPEGRRYHKGHPLHNWGISILLQKNPEKNKDGLMKIFLAYIEDLLDFDTIEQVRSAPAYTVLVRSAFSPEVLEIIQHQVEERVRDGRIPKNPIEVLSAPDINNAEKIIDNFVGDKEKIVFVIHGRNIDARESMYDFLRSLDLHPLTFDEAILATGKVAPYIGEILDAAFSLAQTVVVLMTPDDQGCLREEFRKEDDPDWETTVTPQARLNVIFEAGLAMGGKFRNRTILVELGQLRQLSDLGGRHILKLNNSRAKRNDLLNRLRVAGCQINATGNWQNAGDFESVIET